MNTTSSLFKKYLVGLLILLITVLHYSTSQYSMTFHVLHRELYFLPILLSAFWFGRNIGFMVSLLISFLYSSYILTFAGSHGGMALVIPQIFVFMLVGTLLGWLADQEKAYQKKRSIDNNTIILGRAASAVAHEMKDILNALKSMFVKAEGFQSKELDNNFEAELARLNRMVDILSSYGKQEEGRIFSHDVNTIIKERIKHFQGVAVENGIIFVTELDPDGCPSWIDPNRVSWIIDKLVMNAIEVSSSGGKIYLSSRRGGDFCTISVRDDGPGIRPENLNKIFNPFFTTKADGHGLALAGCCKSLHDMGGDISVKSVLGEGAEFIVVVPREHSGKSLAEDVAKTVLKGHSDSQLYRE